VGGKMVGAPWSRVKGGDGKVPLDKGKKTGVQYGGKRGQGYKDPHTSERGA